MSQAISIAVLCVATAPLARLCLRWRFVRAFPRVALLFGAVIAAYVGSIAAVARWLPVLLMPLAAVVAVAAAYVTWRSRSGYGRSRGLPPGSLWPIPAGPWLDHMFYVKQGRRYGPIFKMSHFFHPMVCTTSLAKGLGLLRREDDVRLLAPKVPFDRFLPCGHLPGMDPDRHKIYRPVIQSSITSEVIAECEEFLQGQVRETLATLAEEGARRQEGVHALPYWDRFLFVVYARMFFGIVPKTPQFEDLSRLYPVIDRSSRRAISMPVFTSDREVFAALEGLEALLKRQLAEFSRCREAGRPYHRCFLDEMASKNPEFADDVGALRLLIYVMQVAATDVAGLLQWLLKKLSDHPEWGVRLREELAAGQVDPKSPESVANRFIQETLRMEQMEHLYRRVLEEIEWDGFRIPKGWLLRVSVRDAHRDPAIFPEPDRFNPDRFLGRHYKREEYLPFGAFGRACIGERVAKAVARSLLCGICEKYDWRQVGVAEREHIGWHWTPGRDFRVALERTGR